MSSFNLPCKFFPLELAEPKPAQSAVGVTTER